MKRRHMFEFHELARCPTFVRETVIETLGNGLHWSGLSSIIGPAFEEFCDQAKPDRVLELCSGSGRPVADLAQYRLDKGESVPTYTLSDLFPNHASWERAKQEQPQAVDVCRESVDATAVRAAPEHDARMMVNAFHHFDSVQARAILEDCANNGKSVFVFEGAPRGVGSFISLTLSSPKVLLALLANPLLAPRHKLLKAVFTYMCPILPMVFMWDSVITNMRIYDRAELESLVKAIPDYCWTYREVPFGQGARAVAFFGVPTKSTQGEQPLQMELS